MLSSQRYDIAIVGGGMVGLAAAIGLAMADLNVVVIDAGNTEAVTGQPRLRVSALNKASQQLLTNLGAWQNVDMSRVGAYQQMSVWAKNGLGHIDFDSHDLCQQQLGSIVENDVVSHALAQRASELPNLTHIMSQQVNNLVLGDREAWLSLANGSNISADLVIAADGANSWVRQQCQIPLTYWDYGHHGIVATVRCQLPHQATARQVFTPDGPLALLPLNDPHLCSIVWSVPPAKSEALLALDGSEFSKQLTATFDARLGICELVSERQAFPLRMRFARHFAQSRLLLVGDAAHTIHPLAGQGVNLGFLDAANAIEHISLLAQTDKDIGAYHYLRPLERARKAEAMQMVAAMEGFKQLFAGEHPLKKVIRDFGLNLVDNCPPIKKQFMRQALGLDANLPVICRAHDSASV
ncbi:FAD-dependent monooxygenase [Shewanella marina]|uniref:FAD-dependent monooxygenase n=1 Tax=Shewanella marina TaxID=487319 RepID=UPI000470908D|nr:FAD-dependent monooxygenase [Shewanella marina]